MTSRYCVPGTDRKVKKVPFKYDSMPTVHASVPCGDGTRALGRANTVAEALARMRQDAKGKGEYKEREITVKSWG